MSINALSSSSTVSQMSFLNKTGATSGSGGCGPVQGGPPPGGRPDGGGLVAAIANALKEIGVTSSTGSSASSTDASTAATTDSTAAASSTGDTSSTDGSNVAQALGSFLQSLMGALHAQGGASENGPPPYGEGQQAQAMGGACGGGGPGRLASDLQSLISRLGNGTATASTTSSTSATSASGTDDTTATNATSDLESTFKNLLDQLSGSGSTGGSSADSNDKLASFLQALSNNLSGAGTSGNLINTTV
jgi:hypothetical protein